MNDNKNIPGTSRSPAICAGPTPCRSSRAWCRTAPPPWRRSTTSRLRLKARAGEADLDRAWQEEWAREADRVAAYRRQGRRRGLQDHRRQPLHARRQLLLQRRALHPARRREDGDVSQGAALLPGRDGSGCIPTSSGSRCPTRRLTLPAYFVKGRGDRPAPDRRAVRRHGQRQGDERHLRRPRSRQARLQRAGDRRAGPVRAAAAAQHPEPPRLRGGGHRRPTTSSRRGPRSIPSASP